MRIFISHASEDEHLAGQIEVELRKAGHEPFLASLDVPPSTDHTAEIKARLRRSALLVFLASRGALDPTRYPTTEIGWAQQKWRNPIDRCVTVLLGAVTSKDLPPWPAGGSTIPSSSGYLPAKVREAVERVAA